VARLRPAASAHHERISLLAIAGPTASGKTRLAIDLAHALGGEVVNADSQQVYRGLDAGTAKPSPAERAEVPHHLFDVADPGAGFDAARWLALADDAIEGIAARGRLPIVCGGTGLYLRALLHGVADAPGRDPALRARLAADAEREGRAALHARLAALDPAAAARIGPNDLVRIVRALEIAASGRTQTERFAAHGFAEDRYRFRLLALDLPREELHRRIEARAPAVLDGLVAEIAALLARGPLPPRLPIGYADAALLLEGSLDRVEALRRVVVAHRRYARRQIVWLRREPGVEWLHPPVEGARLALDLAGWRGRVL
jgi:tRNA dimethylallyltransferase